MRADVLEEFAAAASLGREWLPESGFSVCLYGPALRAYKAAWMRRWRRVNPQLARAKDKERYRRQRGQPTFEAKRRRSYQKANKRRREPDRIERTRAQARRYYHKRKARLVATS